MLMVQSAVACLVERPDATPRSVLMAVLLPEAGLALLLMVNSLLGHPQLWPLYALTFGIGMLSGLRSPASTGIQCRDTSSISPRQANRGRSST